jgi:hypothetical protein
MSSREEEKRRRRQERIAREQAAEQAAKRRQRLLLLSGALAVTGVIAAVAVIATSGENKRQASSTMASGPLLASTSGEASGQPVNGIQCQTSEQVLFHIHAHLAVYVSGLQRTVPQGIGIAPPRQEQQSSEGPFVTSGACFYWLHSHTSDGVIHIESPIRRTYTLGDYFAIWNQPLGPSQAGPAKGAVTAYLNGRKVSGDPRAIPLKAHALVQLDVGAPVVPPVQFRFPSGL